MRKITIAFIVVAFSSCLTNPRLVPEERTQADITEWNGDTLILGTRTYDATTSYHSTTLNSITRDTTNQ